MFSGVGYATAADVAAAGQCRAGGKPDGDASGGGNSPWAWSCKSTTPYDVNGTNYYSIAFCAAPALGHDNCKATTLNWAVGGLACSAAVPETVSDSFTTFDSTANNTTGSAKFGCQSGIWSAPSSATCTATCPAQVVSWGSPAGCTAPVTLSTLGATIPVLSFQTYTSGYVGSGTASCSSQGQWTVTGGTCSDIGVLPAPTPPTDPGGGFK